MMDTEGARVGEQVVVTTKHSGDRKGTIIAIDRQARYLVLLTLQPRAAVIFERAITKIVRCEEEQCVEKGIFTRAVLTPPQTVNTRMEDESGKGQNRPQENVTACNRLDQALGLFKANRFNPQVLANGTIELMDGEVEIYPPYIPSSCSSMSPIVLERIQQCLRSLEDVEMSITSDSMLSIPSAQDVPPRSTEAVFPEVSPPSRTNNIEYATRREDQVVFRTGHYELKDSDLCWGVLLQNEAAREYVEGAYLATLGVNGDLVEPVDLFPPIFGFIYGSCMYDSAVGTTFYSISSLSVVEYDGKGMDRTVSAYGAYLEKLRREMNSKDGHSPNVIGVFYTSLGTGVLPLSAYREEDTMEKVRCQFESDTRNGTEEKIYFSRDDDLFCKHEEDGTIVMLVDLLVSMMDENGKPYFEVYEISTGHRKANGGTQF